MGSYICPTCDHQISGDEIDDVMLDSDEIRCPKCKHDEMQYQPDESDYEDMDDDDLLEGEDDEAYPNDDFEDYNLEADLAGDPNYRDDEY